MRSSASPLQGVLVVQGGPGTGKTAVALHRAAYLLYRHRERIAKSGVLLVGPSPVFLKYIEKVLPSLGETGAAPLHPRTALPGSRHRDLRRSRRRRDQGTLRDGESARPPHRQLRAGARARRTAPGGSPHGAPAPQGRALGQGARPPRRDPHNAARTGFVSGLLKTLAEDLAVQMGLDGAGERSPELLDERAPPSTSAARSISRGSPSAPAMPSARR